MSFLPSDGLEVQYPSREARSRPQVVPTGMEELFADPDPERAERAMQAMLGMRKLDIAALRSAADGIPAS
jgi:hypothetical protein